MTETVVTQSIVFVRGIHVEAEIGIHGHEYGRTQPLIIDVELTIDVGGFRENIADTVNYEAVVHHAQQIAAEGHVRLVETYAERLARACLGEPRVIRARVRVEKPQALAPAAQAAGVDLTLEHA